VQGELERTRAALDFVSYARVHLTFREKKLFDKNTSPAKAAVTIFTDKTLNTAQVEGIQTLVASAVEGMQKSAVTVLSADGRVLSRQQHAEIDNLADFQQQQQLEKDYQAKLNTLVGLLFVPADYAVSVSVHTNAVARKEVNQRYLTDKNGQGFVVHKKQTSQKSKLAEMNENAALGNQEQTEIKFAHGTKTEEITEKAGEILRLSVAVVVKAEVPKIEQQQLLAAIQAAIGYQPKRGDQLSLQFIAPAKSMVVDKPHTQLKLAEVAEVADLQLPTNWTSYLLGGSLLTSGFIWSGLVLFCLLFSVMWYVRQRHLSVAKKQLLLIELQQWLQPVGGQSV
jgi:flagellar M-ring protein FliF